MLDEDHNDNFRNCVKIEYYYQPLHVERGQEVSINIVA
jgi:hypothetical protein